MPSRDAVTLHVVSPCEHGKNHHIKELPANYEFSVPECKDTRGHMRWHVVTAEKYPTTVVRR